MLFTFLKIDVVRHSETLLAGPRTDVVALLDRLEKFVEAVTRRHGGEVWSWAGDGGLCAFPAGQRLTKVRVAVAAALDLLRGVSPFDLSPEPFPQAKERIKLRIAAHLGAAELRRNRGRVHSPDINFVAHLERKATPNSIIASTVWSAAKRYVGYNPAGYRGLVPNDPGRRLPARLGSRVWAIGRNRGGSVGGKSRPGGVRRSQPSAGRRTSAAHPFRLRHNSQRG